MEPSKSNFATCALNSGLVSSEEIREAVARLRLAQQTGELPAGPLTDEHLAEQLLRMGKLNRWQCEQLQAGRSDFNLGPYHLIDSLGYGGMGQVFKAEHVIMGRAVAVKVLPRSKSTPEAIANFNREVRTQAQLDHENLVRAHDAGFDKQVHFLVTEYVPGTDLRKLVRREGPLSMPAAASIIMQAARGLEYAHKRGLIHRDIKPGNILVTADGRAKLSDLGLASFFKGEESDDPRKNKVVGTADYIAPEQVVKAGHASVASDIYSLGCTLYYAVTGKVPFPGGTYKEKWHAHRTKEPIDPRRLNAGLSSEFVKLIRYMMAKEPAKRPRSAAEVIQLCAAWVDAAAPLVAHQMATPGGSAADASGINITGSTRTRSLARPSDSQSSRGDGSDETSGQHSQGTHPVASGLEETVTTLPHEDFRLPLPLLALIIAGGTILLLAAGGIIAWSIWELLAG